MATEQQGTATVERDPVAEALGLAAASWENAGVNVTGGDGNDPYLENDIGGNGDNVDDGDMGGEEDDGLGPQGLGGQRQRQRQDGNGERRGSPYVGITPFVRLYIPPHVYLRALAWNLAHGHDIGPMTLDEASRHVTKYIEYTTANDMRADLDRPPSQRQYDWQLLQLEGMQEMLDDEVQSRTSAIISGDRKATADRLRDAGADQKWIDFVLMGGEGIA